MLTGSIPDHHLPYINVQLLYVVENQINFSQFPPFCIKYVCVTAHAYSIVSLLRDKIPCPTGA